VSPDDVGKEPDPDQPGWAAPPPPTPPPAAPPPAAPPPPPPPPPAAPPPAAPAGFPAPPAWGAPPPPGGAVPTARRRRRWPWVLGALLAVIVALAVTGTLLFVQKIKPPIDAANDYLGELVDRDYEAAFDRLCEQDQADSSPESFERDMTGDNALDDIESFEVNPFDVDVDGDRATVAVDINSPDFDIEDVLDLRLQKEDGDWRPCGGFYGFAFDF
jgi:hypothetical protein